MPQKRAIGAVPQVLDQTVVAKVHYSLERSSADHHGSYTDFEFQTMQRCSGSKIKHLSMPGIAMAMLVGWATYPEALHI